MSETHPKINYGAIFLALLVLTIIEVFAASLPISKLLIALVLITFAIIKAGLVAMFYMHLKFEKILLAAIVIAPFIFSIILVLLVGFDIGHIPKV